MSTNRTPEIIDRGLLLPRICDGSILQVWLDIGCGPSKLEGAIGIDALDYDGVDLIGDVFDVLASFPDQSVDYVYSKHFFEHVSDLSRLIDEVSRVLKVGGTMYVIAPHFSNPYYYSDPTHRTPFGLYTFCYYARADEILRRQVPVYQRELVLSLQNVQLSFQTNKGQYVRKALKKLIELTVNISPYTKEIYEEIFCYLMPCYEVRYSLCRTV